MDFFSCVWTTLVSAPISPRSFIIILRFLVSHKAQCWSSSDNYYMASELYRSTSKQFLKESLNIHLGLVAKTIDSTSFKSDIFKCTGSDFFFCLFFSFPENYRYRLSEFEHLVKTITERNKKNRGC